MEKYEFNITLREKLTGRIRYFVCEKEDFMGALMQTNKIRERLYEETGVYTEIIGIVNKTIGINNFNKILLCF